MARFRRVDAFVAFMPGTFRVPIVVTTTLSALFLSWPATTAQDGWSRISTGLGSVAAFIATATLMEPIASSLSPKWKRRRGTLPLVLYEALITTFVVAAAITLRVQHNQGAAAVPLIVLWLVHSLVGGSFEPWEVQFSRQTPLEAGAAVTQALPQLLGDDLHAERIPIADTPLTKLAALNDWSVKDSVLTSPDWCCQLVHTPDTDITWRVEHAFFEKTPLATFTRNVPEDRRDCRGRG